MKISREIVGSQSECTIITKRVHIQQLPVPVIFRQTNVAQYKYLQRWRAVSISDIIYYLHKIFLVKL